MRYISTVLAAMLLATAAQAQQPLMRMSSQAQVLAENLAGLQSNSVIDMEVIGDLVWVATGSGLAFSDDAGANWQLFGEDEGIGKGEVTALAVRALPGDTLICVATAFDSLVPEGTLPAGGGIAFSSDMGRNWMLSPQPGPTPVQNVSFDVAIHNDNSVWITSFGGGTRRTTDLGASWEVVTPDSTSFDPLCNLNHRAFATTSGNGVLWVGTAGGINKSTDDGNNWANIRFQNQEMPISGNFIVALSVQNWQGNEIIWASTRQAADSTEPACDELLFPGSAGQFNAVSVSRDGGLSWQRSLEGIQVHNFAFDDSVAYAASDDGVFKSLDFGQTWARYPGFYDADQDFGYLSERVFAVGVGNGHRLWIGGPDGLASTVDDGLNWKIQRGSQPAGIEGEARTYAYPSPFSPLRHNRVGSDGHIRFQYDTRGATSVSVRIYDFAMDLVAEVVSDRARSGPGQFFEVWDGRNSRGEMVANGVYFYSLELDGDGVHWGKFIVMN